MAVLRSNHRSSVVSVCRCSHLLTESQAAAATKQRQQKQNKRKTTKKHVYIYVNTNTTTTITNTATNIIIITINSMITTTLGGSSGGCSSLQPPILHGECSPKGACLNEVTSGRGDEKNKIIYIYIYVYVYISNQTKQRSTKTRYNNKYVYKAYKTRRNTHIYIYI